MINLQFSVSNPWHRPFDNLKCWAGRTPFEHKFWEFELYRDSSLLSVALGFTVRQSHAGLHIELGLFGYCAHYTIYDNRHWDYTHNKYETHE